MAIETASILVVEDDPIMCAMIRHTLKRLGIHDVHFSKDGTEALKQLTIFTPDVILSDIHMRPLGGIQFVKVLRAVPKASINSIHVIFISADTTRATLEKARALGSVDYIVKPPRIDVLKAKIEHAINNGSAEVGTI